MMTYLLQVSTCWIVFYGIYLLFLQKETFFTINRYYLLSALFVGLMVPFMGGFLPANNTSTEIYQVMTQVTTAEIIPQKEQTSSTFSWISLLYWAYAAGSLIVFSRFIYGLSRIYSLYKGADKTKYKNYTLVEPSKYHLPFSFFHFIFISKKLPLNKDVEKVLKHEELHAHQWHSLDIVLTELLQIFFWFNPILIFYKSALKQSHEFLADAYVTQDHNRSSYGQLLLRQSTSGLEIALANHFFHSQIKKRITMLYKEKSKRPAMVKYLAAIPVLAAMLFIFSSSKMDNKMGIEPNDECISMQIENHSKYTLDGQPISLSQFEVKINSDNPPKCISLRIKHETYVNSITPILEAASKAKIEVQLFKDDLNANDMLSDKNFGGRKIISRVNVQYLINDKTLSGTITIDAEADKSGKIIYAEISKEKTTIKDREILKKVLQMAKTNKIEKGEGNVKGQFVYNFNIDKNQSNFNSDTQVAPPPPPLLETDAQGEPTYKVVEEMPRFPGCEEVDGSANDKEQCAKQKMLEFIYNNLTYPSSARNAEIEGMVVIQFVVEKDGKITNGKIVREIGGGCGNESLKVVNIMPTWIPGKQEGKAVRVQYTLPVKFKLESKKDISDEQKNFLANVTAFGKKSEKAKKENLVIKEEQSQGNLQSNEDVFKVVEEMPRFQGCEDEDLSLMEKDECSKKKMLEYIYTNLKYPKEARKKGIDGMVIIQFIVEKDGSVSSSNILRDPGAGTGTEAKRIVDKMPKWIPGKQRGKTVRVQYTLPVKYKLEGDTYEIKNSSLNIERSNFIKLEQLSSLFDAVGLSSACKVEKYRFVHVPYKANALVQPTNQDKFNNATKELVDNAHAGDNYFLEDIYCQCPGDKEAKHYGGISIKIEADKIEKEVDQKPLFPDASSEKESVDKLLNFVFKSVKYPEQAIQNNIEGMAVVKFVVNTEGGIQNVKIVKSPGWGIDEVVSEMMSTMQEIDSPWTPAKIDNQSVNFEYVLPVKFKLEDNQIEEAKSRKLDMQDLKISPNPSEGQFNLTFNIKDKTPVDIMFYSTNGQVLKTLKKVNVPFNKKIDLSDFNSQTIFMNIIQKNKIYSDKIIVR